MIKGNYTFKTGHVSANAFLTISYTRIDFQNEVASVTCSIYKSEEDMGAVVPEIVDFSLLPEEQVNEDYTLPKFTDVFGIEKLQEVGYNPVIALYGIATLIPKLSDFK